MKLILLCTMCGRPENLSYCANFNLPLVSFIIRQGFCARSAPIFVCDFLSEHSRSHSDISIYPGTLHSKSHSDISIYLSTVDRTAVFQFTRAQYMYLVQGDFNLPEHSRSHSNLPEHSRSHSEISIYPSTVGRTAKFQFTGAQ